MSKRTERINELIKREISQIIRREIEVPEGLLITVLFVQTSRDLQEAKIWLSVFPSRYAPKILKEIDKKIGYLQGLLNRRLKMQPLPRIKFALDYTEEKASQVEDILSEVDLKDK